MVLSTLRSRLAALPPVVWLLIITAACLVPFANKAVHIDDPLFVRAAQQIQKDPLNFYGFKMNWWGYTSPMVDNFDSPPLASYYLAAVAALIGWSEPALHLGFLIPVLAAAWGMFALARRLCAQPFLAALLSVLTPVFLVSASTIMCDVLLLAFWVWSLVWFERALRTGDNASFVISGLLAGLTFLSKFTGLALIPLLAFWGFSRLRRGGWWMLALLLPLLFVGTYEWWTHILYGKGLLFTAAGVAARLSHRGQILQTELLGVAFLGGCFLPVLLYLPKLWAWSARNRMVALALFGASLLLFPFCTTLARLAFAKGQPNWLLLVQTFLFLAAGFVVLLLAATDFLDRRDSDSLLLALWVLGVFVFATSVNWTVNGRSILPMVPAIGILVVRRLERRAVAAKFETAQPPTPENIPATTMPMTPTRAVRPWLWPSLGAAALSLFVLKADYELAGAGRTAAADLCTRYQHPGKVLWFEGHWGFQFYMEQHQARALEWPFLFAESGDMVVVPTDAVNTFDISSDLVRLVDVLDYHPNTWCTTMSFSAGAGFYAGVCGPFPYSLGPIAPERFFILEVTQSLQAAAKRPGGISSTGALAALNSRR